MAERYSRIFSLAPNLYVKGCPVMVKAGALLKDNETSQLIGQIKLCNISEKTVKLVKLSITALDSMGRAIGTPFSCDYLDLSASRGDDFGAKTPIKFQNLATRAFEVSFAEIGFDDNTVWSAGEDEIESLPAQTSAASFFENDEYVLRGYKASFGANANFIPAEANGIWLCACGEINHSNEERCYKCNSALSDMLSVDKENLKISGTYATAKALIEKGDKKSLERAITLLGGIKDFEDSAELIEKCNELIKTQDAKNKKIIKISVIASAAAVVLFLLTFFLIYPLIAKATGNYSVYIRRFGIEEFEIKEGTTEIEGGAFAGCHTLKSVKIPDSVVYIGDRAFINCSSLTDITIPDGVTYIGVSAFQSCQSLTSIVIPEGVTWIGGRTFENCDSLTSIVIPEGVTWIGSGAFWGCESLKEIVIPDSVTYLEDTAFNYTYLENVTAPAHVFGKMNTKDLKTAVITTGGIGYSAFSSSKLTNVTIKNGVTSIGDRAFDNCDNLKSVIISDTVTDMGSYAFHDCDSLTSVTIGNSATVIRSYAFYDCDSLTSVTIPTSVSSIFSYAFYSCKSLTSIKYRGTLYQWNNISKFSTWDLYTGAYSITYNYTGN